MNPVYFVVAVAIANVAVSFTILRSEALSTCQKALQLGIVWLLPLIGAVICWAFASSQSSPSKASTSFLPLRYPSDNAGSDGHGLGGARGSDGGSGGSH